MCYNVFMKKETQKVKVRLLLKEVLEKRGISSYALARDSGVNYVTIHKIVHGQKKGITFEVLGKICECLGVSPNEIIEIVSLKK